MKADRFPISESVERIANEGGYVLHHEPTFSDRWIREVDRLILDLVFAEEHFEDVVRAVFRIRAIEKGRPQQMTMEEMEDAVSTFLSGCRLGRLFRDGLLVKLDDLSLFHPRGSWRLPT